MSLITAMLENDLPAVNVETSYVRKYSTQYAAHILGYRHDPVGGRIQRLQDPGLPMNALVGGRARRKRLKAISTARTVRPT